MSNDHNKINGINDMEQKGVSTRALHAGWRSDPATGAFGLPIYLTAGYEFKSTEYAADLFQLKEPGYIYSRLGHPTAAAFEAALASVEGGVGAIATSSGQAAFTLLTMALASAGDHVIVARSVYGGTLTLLKNLFGRFGLDVEFVDIDHPCNVQAAIRDNTRAVICEVIGNPTMNVAPIETVAGVAHRAGVPFVVDNTFSPVLCKPFELGADLVVYSTTKYISGLGNVIGGAVIDSGNFDWSVGEKWASLNRPDPAYHGVVFTDAFGPLALIAKLRASLMRDVGACPSPFDCYLLHASLGTLALRMERHSANAMRVAEFLAEHPAVARVSYPGIPSHPQHELAKQYFRGGYSGMMAFDIQGGYDAGVKFLNGLSLFANVANVGDMRSMAIHSASTTHSQLSPEERAASGIGEGMIRLSIGLEDAADIVADLEAALKQSQA